MFRCVINLAASLSSPHWRATVSTVSSVWTKEVLMMIRSQTSPGLTKHSLCMAGGQFLREYKGNEGGIMPINMVWRWEVRGPRGLVEVLVVVRILLDTWSLG